MRYRFFNKSLFFFGFRSDGTNQWYIVTNGKDTDIKADGQFRTTENNTGIVSQNFWGDYGVSPSLTSKKQKESH